MTELRAASFTFDNPDSLPIDWDAEPFIDRHGIRIILQIDPKHVGALTVDFQGFAAGSAVVAERKAAGETYFIIEVPDNL